MSGKIKKKKIKEKHPEVSSKYRPTYMPFTTYCHVCKSVVQVAVHQLSNTNQESIIMEEIEKMCVKENFITFKYP